MADDFHSYLEKEGDGRYYKMNTLAYYYEELSKKKKELDALIDQVKAGDAVIVERLEEVNDTLTQRLAEWDGKIESFPDDVTTLLGSWAVDGTLDTVIQTGIVDEKLAPVVAQLAETEAEIFGVNDRVSNLVIPLSPENSNIQVTDALVSTTKAKTFNLLTERLEESEFELKETLNRRVPETVYTEGFYIHTLGHIATLSGWKYSAPIALKQYEKIVVKTRGSGSNVSIITKVDSNGENRIPLVTSVNSDVKRFTYTATEDMLIALSGNSLTGIEYTILSNPSVGLLEVSNRIKTLKHTLDYSTLFSTSVHIGDSLTRGFYAEYPSGERNRSFNYPSALAQKTNWEATNLGISGATASSWYQTHQNTDLSGYDVAFICLGRNGRFSDPGDRTAYDQIISKLKSESPNAVIFILSLPPSDDGGETSVNVTVKTIADDNDLPYLDIATTGVMNQQNGNIYRPTDGVHFNKIGYAAMGLTVLEQMNEYINNHLEEFTDLHVAL